MTDGERQLLTHVSRFGSDGYPVRKSGRGWVVDVEAYGMRHPGRWSTKREAIAGFEALHVALLDRAAAESMREAKASENDIEAALIRRHLARLEAQ